MAMHVKVNCLSLIATLDPWPPPPLHHLTTAIRKRTQSKHHAQLKIMSFDEIFDPIAEDAFIVLKPHKKLHTKALRPLLRSSTACLP